MPVEVVHGDSIVPIAQIVFRVGCLLLSPHAADRQQHSCNRKMGRMELGATGNNETMAGLLTRVSWSPLQASLHGVLQLLHPYTSDKALKQQYIS